MDAIIRDYNNLVERELERAQKSDFICLTDLLIAREKIIIAKTKEKLSYPGNPDS